MRPKHAALLCLSAFLWCASPANAQTPLEKIRDDVRRLSAIHCDPAVPAATHALNRRVLARRREALALLLEQQIAELNAYPERAGIALTREDQTDLERAKAPLQAELAAAQMPETEICANLASDRGLGAADAAFPPTVRGNPSIPAVVDLDSQYGAGAAPSLSSRSEPRSPFPALAYHPASPSKPARALSPSNSALKSSLPSRPLAADTAGVQLTPAQLTFKDQTIGTASTAQAVTYTNSTSSPVTPNKISFTGDNPGDFLETQTCEIGSPLAPGGNCQIQVEFTPTAAGARKASLSVEDSAAGSPRSVSLSGTATEAPPLQQAAGVGGSNAVEWHSMFTRAVAGIDVSGASSLPTQQKVFLEFNLSAPLGLVFQSHRTENQNLRQCLDSLNAAMTERFGTDRKKTPLQPLLQSTFWSVKSACAKVQKNEPQIAPLSTEIAEELLQTLIDRAQARLYNAEDPTNHRTWIWLNPRITSLPQQTGDFLTNVQSSSPTFSSLAKSNFNQIVQGFELLGGFEFVLNKPGNAIAFGNARLSSSLTASAGFTTPFAATSATVQEFNVPPTLTSGEIQTVFGVPAAKLAQPICMANQTPTNAVPCTNVIAFVPPDRTRFYLQYYVGLRLKTFFYRTAKKSSEFGGICSERTPDELCPIFPGTFDLGAGQNAAVSGGKLRGWVLRSEAFYPLPFADSFHLFFTSWVHVGGHNLTTTPVILDSTSPTVGLFTPGVTTVPILAPNRDYYRLGVGVDLAKLVTNYLTKQSKSSANAAGAAAQKK